MFSKGQTIFAILFAISFILTIFVMYRKDISIHKQHYKGIKWILLGFILFIAFLVAIKTVIKN